MSDLVIMTEVACDLTPAYQTEGVIFITWILHLDSLNKRSDEGAVCQITETLLSSSLVLKHKEQKNYRKEQLHTRNMSTVFRMKIL